MPFINPAEASIASRARENALMVVKCLYRARSRLDPDHGAFQAGA
jgi:hypothetical protein